MGRWRESRVLLIVVILAVLAAVPAVLTVTGVRNVWALGIAAVGAAVVVAIAAVWQERYKRVAQHRDEQLLKIEEGCLVFASGRLPRVREISDPITLGVHPSMPIKSTSVEARESHAEPRVPPYVPRDIDEQLREFLARGGFVLLVGHSTAGKSRTAYEAMAATLADHVLIAPADRAALPAAVEKAAETKKCVLWLNDLENFLGSGGLTRTQVTRLRSSDGEHRVILATLRMAEERRFTEETAGLDDRAHMMNQQVRETLEQAHRIELVRLFTPEEQKHAQSRSWDPRIADALKHASDYGIAEYLAAGPELLRGLNQAWEVGANPRGAALVIAAIDTRRAGYLSALPRQLLEQLHQAYLEQQGGNRLRPETLDNAWAWATKPRRSTTALLQSTTNNDFVKVFDYLVDHVQRRASPTEQIPEQLITTALRYASASDADTIASRVSDLRKWLRDMPVDVALL